MCQYVCKRGFAGVSNSEDENPGGTGRGVYVEDALILASVGLLFWLGVFRRGEAWAQIALLGVLALMVVVMVRRLRRAHRALTEEESQ